MAITYRLALAQLGTSSLGTVIISDIFKTIGVPEGEAPLTYSKILNAPGALEFVIPIDHSSVTPSNFAVGQREIHLYRKVGSGSEVLVWAGYLSSVDVEGWTARFSCLGWYSRLKRRVVETDLYYQNVDQLDIAWNLIAHAQSRTNGNIGITRNSSTASGITRTAVYCIENDVNIASAIEELASSDDGFDFEITSQKAWKTYYPRRAVSTGITLDADTHLNDFSYSQDTDDLTTQARITLDSVKCDLPVVLTQSANTSTYGLLQTTVDSGSSRDQTFLAGLLREEIRNNSAPRFRASAALDSSLNSTYDASSFTIGDVVTIKANRGAYVNLNRTARITRIGINCLRGGREQISLELDGVV